MPALPSTKDATLPLSDLSTLLSRKLHIKHLLLPRQNTMMGNNPQSSSNTHSTTAHNIVVPVAACLGVLAFFVIVTVIVIFTRRRRNISHKPSRSDGISKEWPSNSQHGRVDYYKGGAQGRYQELGEVRKAAKEKSRWQRRKEAPLPETPAPPRPPPESSKGEAKKSWRK